MPNLKYDVAIHHLLFCQRSDLQLFAILIAILIHGNHVFAQQWGMDEAYYDWRDTRSEGFSIRGLLGLVILVGVIWLISKGVKAVKEEHEKNLELRKLNEKKTEDILSDIDQVIDSINQKK